MPRVFQALKSRLEQFFIDQRQINQMSKQKLEEEEQLPKNFQKVTSTQWELKDHHIVKTSESLHIQKFQQVGPQKNFLTYLVQVKNRKKFINEKDDDLNNSRGVNNQGFDQKGSKGTLGKTSGSPAVTRVCGNSSSSPSKISSILIRLGGKPVEIIVYLRGEIDAGVGAIAAEGGLGL